MLYDTADMHCNVVQYTVQAVETLSVPSSESHTVKSVCNELLHMSMHCFVQHHRGCLCVQYLQHRPCFVGSMLLISLVVKWAGIRLTCRSVLHTKASEEKSAHDASSV